MLQVMSFIEIRNSIGPNRVPCGAPESTLIQDELWWCPGIGERSVHSLLVHRVVVFASWLFM